MQVKQEERTGMRLPFLCTPDKARNSANHQIVTTTAPASIPFPFLPPMPVTNAPMAPFMMRVPTGPKADRIPKGPRNMMVASVAPSMAPVEPKADKAKRIAMARFAERHTPPPFLPSSVALRRGQKLLRGSKQVGVGQMRGRTLLEQQRKIMEGKKAELEAQMANALAKSLQEKKLKEKLGNSAKRLEEYAKGLAMEVERLEAEKERTGKGKEMVVKGEEVEVGIKRDEMTRTSRFEMVLKAAESRDGIQKGKKRGLEEALEDGELKQEGEVDFYANNRWAMDMLRNARKKTRHEQVLDGPF